MSDKPTPPTLPARKPDGQFDSFQTWVNKAVSWIGGTNPLCADAKDRVCNNGWDMMRARDEAAFPVRFWLNEDSRTTGYPRRAETATSDHLGRTDKDFAIEFGRYLAASAERYQAAVNSAFSAREEGCDQTVEDADAEMTEAYGRLTSDIHEFRKRATRATDHRSLDREAVLEDAVTNEIERLRAVIDAAVGEFDRGYPLSALNFLLNAQEGLS